MKRISTPYVLWFDEMNILQSEKDKRISLAESLEDAFSLCLESFGDFIIHGIGTKKMVSDLLREQLVISISSHIMIDDYVSEHIDEIVSDFVKNTSKHVPNNVSDINNVLNKMPDTDEISKDLWFFTSDRVIAISENESNTLINYDDMRTAFDKGYSKKKWVTENDNKVRPTHKAVDSELIPIDQAFVVGDSLLMFPGDLSLGASKEETENCRCTVEYS